MKILKYFLWSIAVLLLAGVALILVINSILPGREKKLNDAWGRTLVSLEEFPKQHPKVEENASALALEKLSAALGICLAHASAGADCARAKPAEEAAKAFDAVKNSKEKGKGLSDWLDAQFERGTAEIDDPPELLQQYLTAHAADLAALRRQMLNNEPPTWGYDIQNGLYMELPNLFGQISLHKLLMADALVELHQGRADAAQEDLEASWRLNSADDNNPVLIVRLIAITATRMQAGVVRKFPIPPGEWEARFKGYDPRHRLAESMEGEAWALRQTVLTNDLKSLHDGMDGGGRSMERMVPNFVQRPYLQLSMVETSESERKTLERYLQLDPCQSVTMKQTGADPTADLSWWNIIGKIAIPNLHGMWVRASRVTLEAEMTHKLLEIKRLRHEAADIAWPKTVDGIGDSVCKDGKWDYQVAADGTMSLAFSPKIDWGGNVNGAKIPLAVTEKPAAH